jgi:hypothetical protein
MEPGYMDKLQQSLPKGVDPRLDNRTGDDRPVLEHDPAVPQQVDGPDLMHQAEHAEAVARHAKTFDDVERAGMSSRGHHSLGDSSIPNGNAAGQADDLLETDPGNPDSAPTGLGDHGDVGTAASAFQAEEVAKDARRAAGAGSSETASAGPGERRARSKSSAEKDSKE